MVTGIQCYSVDFDKYIMRSQGWKRYVVLQFEAGNSGVGFDDPLGCSGRDCPRHWTRWRLWGWYTGGISESLYMIIFLLFLIVECTVKHGLFCFRLFRIWVIICVLYAANHSRVTCYES